MRDTNNKFKVKLDKINYEDKKLLLRIHNNLRELNDTILECDDLWLSQVRTLRTDIYDIQRLIDAVPPKDEHGKDMHYATNFVLNEDGDN
jgi:hypothetical protein